MATQGVVSVVRDGSVIVKAVCGSNGMKAPALAQLIREGTLDSIEAIWNAAREAEFGTTACLVVMDGEQHRFEGDADVGPRYRKKFSDPEFNPRWEHGTADFVEIVRF